MVLNKKKIAISNFSSVLTMTDCRTEIEFSYFILITTNEQLLITTASRYSLVGWLPIDSSIRMSSIGCIFLYSCKTTAHVRMCALNPASRYPAELSGCLII